MNHVHELQLKRMADLVRFQHSEWKEEYVNRIANIARENVHIKGQSISNAIESAIKECEENEKKRSSKIEI